MTEGDRGVKHLKKFRRLLRMAPNLYLLEEDGISNFTFEESKSWPKGSCERFKNAIA